MDESGKLDLPRLILKYMEDVERIYSDGGTKKTVVLNRLQRLFRNHDLPYNDYKIVISDTIELIISLSKKEIKLNVNSKKCNYLCIWRK